MKAALMPDRQELYDRIDKRFSRMAESGAIDEVTNLLARELADDLPAMKAIGVPELTRYLADEISLEDAITLAQTQSRRYAKRQMTWIRGQMADWSTFDEPQALIDQCLDLLQNPA